MRFPEQPQYRVVHNNVGGLFNQGDLLPPGTYDDEQLARLLGLGAIEEVPPGEAPRPAPTATAPVVAHLPGSAEAFKEALTEQALATAAGETPPPLADTEPPAPDASDSSVPPEPLAEDLTAAQVEALTAAGIESRADIDAATDEDLLAIPGIGAAALRRLREGRRE